MLVSPDWKYGLPGGELPVGDGGRWDAVLSATPASRKWSTTTRGGCPQRAAIGAAWKCGVSMVLTAVTTCDGGGSCLLLERHLQIDRGGFQVNAATC